MPEPLTELQLAEIEAREAETRRGPWALRDANEGDEEIGCARLHCPARVWLRHAAARGWHQLPTGSWYCPDEHVPGGAR